MGAEMAAGLFKPWIDVSNTFADAGVQAASWDMKISEQIKEADPLEEPIAAFEEPLFSLNDFQTQLDETEPQVELFVTDPQQWVSEQIIHYLYHYGAPDSDPALD